MFDRLASVLLRFSRPILVGLVLASVAAGWIGSGIGFDFSPRSIFLTADDEVLFLAEHRETFGNEDGIVMVLFESEDVFELKSLEKVIELSDALAGVEGIDRVLSLSTVRALQGEPPDVDVSPLLSELPTSAEEQEALKARALGSRLLVHRFINPEGTATAILGIFDDELNLETERRPVLDAVDRMVASYKDEGLALTSSGVPVVNREYAVRLQQDMLLSVTLSVVLICFVLFVLFRNAYSVALPMFAVGLSLVWTVAYMVLSGDSFNIINAIVPTLLLVIGVGDAVHFLTTYYQELGTGDGKETAVRRMVRRVGAACLLTSVTAAIGFGSLIVARIDIIKGMGRVAAVGLLAAYFVILLMVPSVLSLVRAPVSAVTSDPSSGVVGGFLSWLGDIVTRRKLAVVAFTGTVCAVAVAGMFRVETNNFLLEELFPKNPVSVALKTCEEKLTGVMPVEVSIRTDEPGGILEPEVLRGMAVLQRHLAADPFIGYSVSIADLIDEIGYATRGERRLPSSRAEASQLLLSFEIGEEDPRFLESMIDFDRREARISATQRDWGTDNFFAWYDGSGECDPRAQCGTPILEMVDRAFGTVDGQKEGLSVRVTGSNLVAARALSKLVEDMLFSLSTAFIVISLLMMVLLRSLRIGLLSMVPNVLPLFVTFGFMGWVGIPLRTSTALIFSVALGVGVNDTIHFVTRFKEELFLRGDRVEAVRATLLSTGRAILFTSILMIFGFGTMMTTNFVGIFQMGLLGAVTLFTALLGDLLLLPVCLVVFRPWERFIEKKQAAGTWKPVGFEESSGASGSGRAVRPPA